MYLWTKKAEERAKELGLEPRKAGDVAMFGYSELNGGLTAKAWLEKGYVIKAEEQEE